jgi:GGDEF domain-containing protein
MILLRKKKDADNVKDFRPISLVHSFGKLLTKVLALHLATNMNNRVAPNQSTFICGRAIGDNFMAVLSSTELLHARRQASVLLKVDIAKAFDTVGWTFLLELLSHIGCSQRWTEWISMILISASTRIILNGIPGRRICHT